MAKKSSEQNPSDAIALEKPENPFTWLFHLFGARSVSLSTTSAVVLSCVMILISDYVVTTFILQRRDMEKQPIIGLLKPDEGKILYKGKPIDEMTKKEWNAYIGQISYMFQNNALFDSMTIVENVSLPLRQTTRLGKKEIAEKAMAAIEQTELTEVFDKYPSELSGGMQKRADLSDFKVQVGRSKLAGKMTVDNSGKIRICGKGQVDFKKELIDLKMAPAAKRPEYFILATPIEVKGKFSDFVVGIQAGGLVGTVVNFIASPVTTSFKRMVGKELPADGKDVCATPIGPENRSGKPPTGCK